MKLLFLMFVWLVMALLLVAGVVLAVKGSFWLLALGLVGFVLAVAKIGCLSH
ncbi:MAG: hypothetical protein ABSG78_03395 [Verrucomicrobiota bacterium]|jgi:hypothetical protein